MRLRVPATRRKLDWREGRAYVAWLGFMVLGAVLAIRELSSGDIESVALFLVPAVAMAVLTWWYLRLPVDDAPTEDSR